MIFDYLLDEDGENYEYYRQLGARHLRKQSRFRPL